VARSRNSRNLNQKTNINDVNQSCYDSDESLDTWTAESIPVELQQEVDELLCQRDANDAVLEKFHNYASFDSIRLMWAKIKSRSGTDQAKLVEVDFYTVDFFLRGRIRKWKHTKETSVPNDSISVLEPQEESRLRLECENPKDLPTLPTE